jgi:hypothetical protein
MKRSLVLPRGVPAVVVVCCLSGAALLFVSAPRAEALAVDGMTDLACSDATTQRAGFSVEVPEDPVRSGQRVTFSYRGPTTNIDRVELALPPQLDTAGVEATGTFFNGRAATVTVTGRTVVLAPTPLIPGTTITLLPTNQIPSLRVTATVRDDAAGEDIIWRHPTLTGLLFDTVRQCTPVAGAAPMATNHIAATPRTMGTTTTTVPGRASIWQLLRHLVCRLFGWCA